MARKFLVPIDLEHNELRNVTIQNLAGAPSSPQPGWLYYDTGTQKLYYYNGSGWVDTSGGLTFGSVTAQTSYGAAPADGSGTDVPHANHDHGTPTHVASDHSAIRLSDLAVPTADISLNGHKITSAADATSDTDLPPWGQVKAQILGARDPKDDVRWATNGALPAYTRVGNVITANANGALAASAATDQLNPAVDDRFLLKDGAAGADNGIYTITQLGDGTHPWIATRAADADSSAEVTYGLFVWAVEGTANGKSGWLLTTQDPIILNTTALSFAQVASLSNAVAGAGLFKTGANQFDVGAGTGIVVNADDVAVLRTNANGRVPLLYAADVGDGAATSYNIDHNLGTKDVIVQVYQNSDGAQVEPDIIRSTTNRVVLVFASAPSNNQYRVVVHG